MIDQPASDDSIDQLTPVPAGRLSVKLRPLAVPAPSLAIVTRKPICEPALTDTASAVLVRSRSAQMTVIVALSSLLPRTLLGSLDEVASAVFGSGAAVSRSPSCRSGG